MTFSETDHPRATDGTFAEKLGAAPEFELTSPPTNENTLYRYQGDTFTEEGIRAQLGIPATEPRETLDEVIENMREGGERDWGLPTQFKEKRFDLPSEDGYDMDLSDVEWEPSGGEMTNPYARLTDDGDILLTGNYYEDMLWADDFTPDELDDAYPIVEKFFRDRFGAEIIDNGESWNSVMLEFSTTYKPEEFSPSLVANTSEDRMQFIKFVNEHDPGTYGSPYAYADLREQLDEAVVASDRWTALKDAEGLDAGAIADSPKRTTVAPTDAEAIAVARSLSGDEWSGPYQEEIESLAKNGYATRSSALRDGLEATRAATVFTQKQRKAEALLSWLDSKDK
jgi:hypothetical protein